MSIIITVFQFVVRHILTSFLNSLRKGIFVLIQSSFQSHQSGIKLLVFSFQMLMHQNRYRICLKFLQFENLHIRFNSKMMLIDDWESQRTLKMLREISRQQDRFLDDFCEFQFHVQLFIIREQGIYYGAIQFEQHLQLIQIIIIIIIIITMQTTNAPQIIEHLTRSLNYTPYDVKWIPDSSKFMVCGERPRATGLIEIHQLTRGELKVVSTIQNTRGIKSGTFAASPSTHSCFAFGDLEGKLKILDLEKEKVFWEVQAHNKVVNCVDGAGSQGHGYGPCEIVSGGRDGSVRVWDPRQQTPVIALDPVESQAQIPPDCWTVSFGNAHNNQHRVIASGYDNGDVKFFDMKNQMFLWDTNLKNGVCGVQFDRKDIMMNKLGAATLQGKFTIFELRTLNNTTGFASITESAQKATLWGIKHLPQNRDLFTTLGGNGALNLYRYIYPSQREIIDNDGAKRGVPGKVELLNQKDVCQQCISSFDWNRDKMGLGVLCGLDQTVRVMIVTKLNLY